LEYCITGQLPHPKISAGSGLSTKHFADLRQARSEILKFGETKNIFMEEFFCFYYIFKTISGVNKIWERTKKLRGTAPERLRGYGSNLGAIKMPTFRWSTQEMLRKYG